MNHEHLEAIEESVLDIAIQLGSKKRTIELSELYRTSKSQLDYSSENILISIKKLYEKKYLVEGSRLTKETLLNNDRRRQIYNYIKKNPGAHNREIRRTFNIDNYVTFRHLKYLEMFGYLRSKKFMNKKAYFLSETNENNDEMILVLKNERRKKIFTLISRFKKLRLKEIEKALALTHGHIQPHLKVLLEHELVNSKEENNITYYTPKRKNNFE